MHKLKSENHKLLTESVLRSLTQNKITTVLEFLSEDSEKLSTITKLSLPQILEIRNHIINRYSAPVINGIDILANIRNIKKYLCTGITSLDNVLRGGIPIGFITELCGLADSGKTQSCLQIAINCVRSTNSSVLYIDTKGDFSAIRIQKILHATDFSYKEMALIMYKIRVIRVWSMEDLIELLKRLKNKLLIIENLALIIIDSLPCLMFQHLGDSNKIGLAYLNTMVNYTRYLCDVHKLAFVCVNIHTRWIDQDTSDLEDEGEQSMTISKENCVERRNRCLGKYWQHIPFTVIIFEKPHMRNTDENCTQTINVIILKHRNLPCDFTCAIKISELGVT